MTLMELHEILSDRIKITLQEMPDDKRMLENEKSAIIIGAAKQMIANANTILKAQQQLGMEGKKRDPIASALITDGK